MEVLEDYEYYLTKTLRNLTLVGAIYTALATEGKELLDRGEYKEAITKLEKVVSLDPNLCS